jgi:alpha-tubulin suppressor-like RCC1 family protein
MTVKTVLSGMLALLIFAILAACGGSGSAPALTAAAITTQPTDQSVVAGTTAAFTVVATDATGYQWQRSADGGTTFADVAGATAAGHTTAVTALADTGTQYHVLVSGASNSVTSSAVTLTVTAVVVAPGISVHPVAQTITEGQNASFSITAVGTSISYQWQLSTDGGASFTDMAGATGATLTLMAVPLASDAHQFRIVVSNSAGSVTSNAASLSVNLAQVNPAFSTQPANRSVNAPNTATFNVVATGTPSPTLQWQLSTNGGGSFADIVGATGSSYTTAAAGAGDNGNQYRVIATNTASATTSNAATLTVNVAAAPSFTTHPTSVTITAGQNAQFTVAVSGTPTPTLQWQLSTDSGSNWSNVNGAINTVLDLNGVALANNGRQFRAVASNSAGVVNSSAATLTVLTVTVSGPARAVANTRYSYQASVSQGSASAFDWNWGDGTANTTGNPVAKVWNKVGSSSINASTTVNSAVASGTHSATVVSEPISAGGNYSCALKPDGGAACWGFGGDGTTLDRSGLVASSLSGVTALSVGGQTICFLKLDGTAACWGANNYGQLGDGTTTDRVADESVLPENVPAAVLGLTGAVALSISGQHTCAVKTGGTVVCWGLNMDGQLGDGSNVNKPTPSTITGLTGVVAVAAGHFHTCALNAAGTVACWGNNYYGQLGDGSAGITSYKNTPVTVANLTDAVALSAGSYHTCALKADGSVNCWGENSYGQLGDGTTVNKTSTLAISGISNAVALSAGANHTCALKADRSVACWGHNSTGQIGDGTDGAIANRSSPVPVLNLVGVSAISAGWGHTCALKADGNAACWGLNGNAQLGISGSTTNTNTANPVSGGAVFWK